MRPGKPVYSLSDLQAAVRALDSVVKCIAADRCAPRMQAWMCEVPIRRMLRAMYGCYNGRAVAMFAWRLFADWLSAQTYPIRHPLDAWRLRQELRKEMDNNG